ncbi:aspartate 1-decarboxylase, partial [Candidatus Margulisiibacteriota bacterium]
MLITIFKSKIHMATISDTQPYYQGSIGIDKDLIKAAGLVPGEKVAVLNFNNTNRFETYVIEGQKGEISLRGPAAKLGKKGDKVVIISYGHIEQEEANKFKPKIVLVNER